MTNDVRNADLAFPPRLKPRQRSSKSSWRLSLLPMRRRNPPPLLKFPRRRRIRIRRIPFRRSSGDSCRCCRSLSGGDWKVVRLELDERESVAHHHLEPRRDDVPTSVAPRLKPSPCLRLLEREGICSPVHHTIHVRLTRLILDCIASCAKAMETHRTLSWCFRL